MLPRRVTAPQVQNDTLGIAAEQVFSPYRFVFFNYQPPTLMSNHLPIQVSEFFAAAREPFSYDISRNIYIWFGALWGLPIPVVTLLLQSHYLDMAGIETSVAKSLMNPIQWFFLLHPLLFGIVFGILGTIRHDKDNALASTLHELRNLSTHDTLTGLKNRRYFAHIFHDECARSLRQGASLSILFLDIDHFKNINDVHGHHFGDTVLKELGGYLLSHCRPYDTAVRWGGEEFIILLPSTAEREAAAFGERIRQGVEQELSETVGIPLTLSIGVAGYQTDDSLESITDRADRAMYAAKQQGRNRTVCYSELARSTPGRPGATETARAGTPH